MKGRDNWKEIKYKEVYNGTVDYIENRKINDPDFNIEELEQLLETKYVNEGTGNKSEIDQLTLDATIAALQACLSNWKSEKGPD
ncbi:MAG: hypothetical protein ACQESJ_03070 [Bacteroidota bacterium]